MPDVSTDPTGSGSSLNAILSQAAPAALAQSQQNKQDYRKAIETDIVPQLKEQTQRAGELRPPTPPASLPPPKPEYTDPIQAWGSLAMGIAMLGSAFTRQPLTNALNAGAAVNNAYRRGDLEASRQALDTWKAQTNYARQLYEYQDKTYRDALANLKNDRAGTLAELRVLATAYHDEGLLEILKFGQIGLIGPHLDLLTSQNKEVQTRQDAAQLKINDELQKLQLTKDLDAAKEASNAAKKSGDPAAIAQTDEDLHRIQQKIDNYHFVNTRSGSQQAGQPLTDEEVDYYAKRYKITGQLPPLYRDTATRTQIIKRAADMGGGDVGTDIARAGGVRADQTSLTNITRIADAAEAYENTAISNMKIVEDTMPKGVGTNFGPWLDKWVQSGRIGVGDPNVPPYATALVTVANEYAKVMQGATGSQGSTEGTRREAADLLNMAQTTDQVKNVMEVMKQDMENKKASYREQRKAIQQRLSTGSNVEAGLPETGTRPIGDAGSPGEFSKATIDDLLKVIDNPNLTNEQRRAIDARLKELGH